MAIAYHLTFGAYGFWLPNDPRGSWSEYVRQAKLYRFGPATKTSTRHSVAAAPHDQAPRLAAKRSLQRPPVRLSGVQARAAARGFAKVFDDPRYACWACALMPDHVHLVVPMMPIPLRQFARRLKQAATQRLCAEGLWDQRDGSPWARGYWAVYLDGPADVDRAIAYVEANPLREGLRRQGWSFVQAWQGG